MKSEWRTWVRYFNYVGDNLFHESSRISLRHRAIVSELAWVLDIVPEIPCPACGKVMEFDGGYMAFACKCGEGGVITSTEEVVMQWHMEHWKDLDVKQTEEDIRLYGKEE
ncbi:MAG: hypothetical protein ACTSPB_00280 [Candidatus Thorarchaeota archaeon]